MVELLLAMSDRIKKPLQALLQKLLGFETYLFLFSLFIQYTIRWNPKEGDITHFIKQLKSDAKVVDIGANIGIMTSLIAQKCKKGKVYAVEPIVGNVGVLKRVLRFRGIQNTEVMPIALGERSGTLEMRMPVIQGVKMQGLTHVYHPQIAGYDAPYESYEVPQKTLDEVFERVWIDAIKMDVENFEFYVLKGAEALLKRCKPLLYMELWDNDNRRQCMAFLQDLGYTCYVMQAGARVKYNRSVHSHQNFFFLWEGKGHKVSSYT